MSRNRAQLQQGKINELLKSVSEDTHSKTSCSRGSQLASALKEAFRQAKSNRADGLANV